jgi:predicted phosphodiesterase
MKPLIKIFTFFFFAKFFLIAGIPAISQTVPFFKSEIETIKKPWTNLDFYNNPDNFQFAIMGDRGGGIRPGIFEDAILKLNKLYPEFVLSVGDIIAGYTRDTLLLSPQRREIDSIVGQLKMPFFRLPGNHDITNPVMEKDYEQRYGKRYYSFTYKNTLFIILDTNDDDDYSLKPAQTDFVLKTIKDNTGVRWTFVLMHHPIWYSNTNGRFQQIEAALSDRKYTVIAGHTHRYYYEERNNNKYYVIATTGGSSELSGNRFGRFDHVVWMTMTDQGPSFVNLRLDGILPDDVSNARTAPLARALLINTTFRNMVLCTEGDKFTDATLYLRVSNTSDKPLFLDARFFHNHQLTISKPVINLTLAPGSDQLVEIELNASKALPYNELEKLQLDWLLHYDLTEYPDFRLDGVSDFNLLPSSTSSLLPEIYQFLDKTEVTRKPENSNLIARYSTDGSVPTINSSVFNNSLVLNDTKTIKLKYFNNKGQATQSEVKTYSKVNLQKGVKVRSLKGGLKYSYYEGIWDNLPDFSKLVPLKNGVAADFNAVSEVNMREDNFGIVFKGYFYAPKDGMYLFRTVNDDAGRLYIHNNLVVNEDLPKETGVVAAGPAALMKGYHPVEIHYLEQQGDQRIRISSRMVDDADWKLLEIKGSFFY